MTMTLFSQYIHTAYYYYYYYYYHYYTFYMSGMWHWSEWHWGGGNVVKVDDACNTR